MKTLALVVAFSGASLCVAQSGPSLKGSISGRVLDQNGQPLSEVRVTVWRWEYREGRKQLGRVSSDEPVTDADGSFRISELDPGEYLLRAENAYAGVESIPGIASTLPPHPSPVTTYFPNVLDPEAGRVIEATAGAEAKGIEIRVANLKGFRVRGRESGPGRSPLSLKRADALSPWDDRPVLEAPDGTFELTGVAPGTYVIDGTNLQYSARTAFTVKDADIDGLVVQAQPCPKIRGTLTIDGAPAGPTPQARSVISLSQSAMSVPGLDTGNGRFEVSCAAPAEYSIHVPLASGMYLRSMTLDGKGVDGPVLDLTSPADKTLNIALASRAAAVKGIVRDSDGKTLPDVPVTLWSFKRGSERTMLSKPDGSSSSRILRRATIGSWRGRDCSQRRRGRGLRPSSSFVAHSKPWQPTLCSAKISTRVSIRH